MFKITDFSVPELFIKMACTYAGVVFIDFYIEFLPKDDSNQEVCEVKGDKFYITTTDHLISNFYRITYCYLENFERIHDGVKLFETEEEKKNAFKVMTLYLNTLFIEEDKKIDKDEVVAQRLYQYPFIWSAMNNILAPMFDVRARNLKVIYGSSCFLDAAVAFTEDTDFDLSDKDVEVPFLFINNCVTNKPIKTAIMLRETIKAHGLCPIMVYNELMNSELGETLWGLAYLSLGEDDFNVFVDHLSFICKGYDNAMIGPGLLELVVKNVAGVNKTAQMAAPNSGSAISMNNGDWSSPSWFIGIYESMLDQARDEERGMTVHENLEILRDSIWDKVEEKQKEKGLDGLSYEGLLDVMRKDIQPRRDITNFIIEKSLATDRVWS